MKKGFIIVAGLTLVCGCMTSIQNMDNVLSRYHAGDPEEVIHKELRLADYRFEWTPNLPAGEECIIYFLPSGNLHVMTSIDNSGKSRLRAAPFFVPDKSSVSEREIASKNAWDEYVKKRTQKN